MSTEKEITFGELLKRILLSQNISQSDLAEKLGVSRMLVSKWITGKTLNPRRNTMIKIAQVLDVPVEYFLANSKDRSKAKKIIASGFPIFSENLILSNGVISENNRKPILLSELTGSQAFGFIAKSVVLPPLIESGDLVIVSPNPTFCVDNPIVVVYNNQDNRLSLRKASLMPKQLSGGDYITIGTVICLLRPVADQT